MVIELQTTVAFAGDEPAGRRRDAGRGAAATSCPRVVTSTDDASLVGSVESRAPDPVDVWATAGNVAETRRSKQHTRTEREVTWHPRSRTFESRDRRFR